MKETWELISDFGLSVNVRSMNAVGKYVAAHLTVYRDGSVSIASLPSENMVTVEVEKNDLDPEVTTISVDVSIVSSRPRIRLEPL